MPLDPNIFLQGAQLQQNNTANMSNIISKMFPEKEAKGLFDQLKDTAAGAIYKLQSGEQPDPKDMAALKTWDVLSQASNAINPTTGEPFPKNRSVFELLNMPSAPSNKGVMPAAVESAPTSEGISIDGSAPQIEPILESALTPSGKLFNTLSPQTKIPSYNPPAPANPKQAQEAYGSKLKVGEKANEYLTKAAVEKQQAQPKAVSSFREYIDQNNIVNDSIDKAIGQTGFFSAGYVGKKTVGMGGTPADNLDATLKTIQSDAAFSALQKMRDNSPTGGALGSVSEVEIGLLKAAKGALEQAQSPSELKQALIKYKAVRENSLRNVAKAYQDQYGEIPADIAELLKPKPPAAKSIKFGDLPK